MILEVNILNVGLPRWLSHRRIHLPIEETQVWPLGQEDPWRRKWQPTLVLSPGKANGQRSLVGYCPWSLKESDTTKQLNDSNPEHSKKEK